MKYQKPFQSFEQLADLLMVKRGLVADRESLIQHLQDVGYYRLSGYWHIYKKRDSDEFWEGTTFDHVWELYVFDRQFRLAVFDAIERVEVFMRTQLAHLLARDTSPFGFLDRKNLPRMNDCTYSKFMEKCHGVYERSRRGEPFAKHFAETYGDEHDLPPYWMLVNLMDFGMVVTLYKGSSNAIRQEIATQLGVTTRVLDSWLVSLNTVRNICAHHGRLWNRVIGNPPMIPKTDPWHISYEVDNSKMFGVLTVLSYLLEHIAPNTAWRKRLLDMVLALPQRDQERMGFVGEWRECPFWKPYLGGANR